MVDVNYIVKQGHTAKLCLDNYEAVALVKMGPSEKKREKNYPLPKLVFFVINYDHWTRLC